MGSIKQEAKDYKSNASVRNISELNSVDVDIAVLDEQNAEFPYKYIEVNGERYKMPVSVLKNLQVILLSNPNMKTFQVRKSGKGMDTSYVVIPLN